MPDHPTTSDPGPHLSRASGPRLVLYGFCALIVATVAVWGLTELAAASGVDTVVPGASAWAALPITAAALGVPALTVAHRRQRALETANLHAASRHDHTVRTDDRSHRAVAEERLRERYTGCTDQLGHESSTIRLAGVYALASLADDWHGFGSDIERQVCIDLLCAYLRAQRPAATHADRRPQGRDTPDIDSGEQQVRAAIVESVRVRTAGPDDRWIHCTFDLNGANLSGADLTGATLFGANLVEADLTRATLTDANLTGANLTGANLTGQDLVGVVLADANLTRATLAGTNLTGANLTGTNLTGANLARANLTVTNLTGANFTVADLAGANLTKANLTGANLTKADLTGANLTIADLTDATLGDANLARATLIDANLTDATLFGANLVRANLFGANLAGANLTDANLTDAMMTDTTMPAGFPASAD